MSKNKNTIGNYTARQLKLPLDIEKLIDISDPVYTFCEVMNHIDLYKYFAEKGCKTGRKRCDAQKLLKVILFAFMENGICSLREIEKLCRNDIRYMYLLDGMKAPTFATFGNLIRNNLVSSIEDIFKDINSYIFEKDHVDLNHVYIDGTKIVANANRYTWVWKKSCIKNRSKVYEKISLLIDTINRDVLGYLGIKFEKREEYAIEYLSELLDSYKCATGLNLSDFVSGKGNHKSICQRQYQKMQEYLNRLKSYAKHIKTCGEYRNSYSKTDPSATFMRIKVDYMGNDQLLPAYNLQAAVCDEYIAVVDMKPYATDMECFVPLMEKFHKIYGHYPTYPVADAGYGSYNNYLYCEEHGMKKYMKFTMFKKEVSDKKYRDNPYRAVNFHTNNQGDLLCPAGKKFIFKCHKHVYKNKYGRTEELYECENCTACEHKDKCCPRARGNRSISLNRELSSMHKEVLENLESTHGYLLRRNRSIQSEGTFGIIKWDKSYNRLLRKGEKNAILELTLITCGFNLCKYHNKKQRLKYVV